MASQVEDKNNDMIVSKIAALGAQSKEDLQRDGSYSIITAVTKMNELLDEVQPSVSDLGIQDALLCTICNCHSNSMHIRIDGHQTLYSNFGLFHS